jgi:hypothetical protein
MFFFKNIQIIGGNKYYKMWVLIFQLAALLAALDSILVLSSPVHVAFVGLGMSSAFATGFTVMTVVIYLVLVDFALSVFYPNSINEIIQNRRNNANAASWAIALLTLVYCLAAIAVTICVSLFLRHSSAALSIAPPALVDVHSMLEKQQKADASLTATFDGDIDATKAAKQAAISKSQAHRELQALADKGNGWAIGKLQERAKDAASGFDKKASKLQAERTTLLAANAKNFAVVAATIQSSNQFKADNYNRQTQTIADFMLFFSIGATAFQCFAGLMIALYRANFNIGKYERMTPVSTTTTAADAVSTTTESVSTDAPKTAESVSTGEKTVSTAKTGEKQPDTGASVLTEAPGNTLEELITTMKTKIQRVNQECSNYEKRDGTRNGEADTITDRLSKAMIKAATYYNAHPIAVTPDITEQYNKALDRGKGTLTEYKKEKAKQEALAPTLFDTESKVGIKASETLALRFADHAEEGKEKPAVYKEVAHV